jgi:hypothetical protein
MFIQKACRLLALAALGLWGVPLGCQKSPDPEEFGEIITEVPKHLDRPFPLPQLEEPKEKSPEPGK